MKVNWCSVVPTRPPTVTITVWSAVACALPLHVIEVPVAQDVVAQGMVPDAMSADAVKSWVPKLKPESVATPRVVGTLSRATKVTEGAGGGEEGRGVLADRSSDC